MKGFGVDVKKMLLAVLFGVAVVATLVAAIGTVNLFTDYRVSPVIADTMDPSIPAGSLIVSRLVPEQDVHPGDVVVIGDPNKPTSMFGRVMDTTTSDGKYYNISLKGDNQTVPQVSPFKLNNVTYAVVFSVPVIGWLFAFLSSMFGLFLTMLLVSAVAAVYIYGYHSPAVKPEPVEKDGRMRIPGTNEFYGGVDEMKDLFEESRAV